MDANIDTDAVGSPPTPYAFEISAPADTPAYLSTHDAAAVLRKLLPELRVRESCGFTLRITNS